MGRGARRHWLDTVPLYRSIQRQKNGEKRGAIGDGKEIRASFQPSPSLPPLSLESSGKGLARLTFEVSVSK